jgi:four helix bundle protein
MAGVIRFEDLRVWQAAKRQCDLVGELILRPVFRDDGELKQHMNDAALSVMFNISEGFLRRRDKETLNFLRYSFASNGELKAGYYAAQGRKYLAATEAVELIELNDSIARMLRRWMSTLEPDRNRDERPRRPRTQHQGRTRDQERTKDQERTEDQERTGDEGRTEDQERTGDEGRTED